MPVPRAGGSSKLFARCLRGRGEKKRTLGHCPTSESRRTATRAPCFTGQEMPGGRTLRLRFDALSVNGNLPFGLSVSNPVRSARAPALRLARLKHLVELGDRLVHRRLELVGELFLGGDVLG